MKAGLKIVLFTLFMVLSKISAGQPDGIVPPLSGKLLLNPSFAGLSKSSGIWTGVQFYPGPRQEANYLFTLTYDHYSEKLKGGIGWLFYQGFDGENQSAFTGAGIIWAKPLYKGNRSSLIASVNLNNFIFTRQLYEYASAGLVADRYSSGLSEKRLFLKYYELSPRTGILWNWNNISTTISFSIPFRLYIKEKLPGRKVGGYQAVISLSKKNEGIIQGLLSKPYSTNPEITALLSGDHLIVRSGVKTENIKNNFGLFLINNIPGETHGVTGLAGKNIKNMKINISGGFFYSLPYQKITLCGEAFIGITIPDINHNKEKPWALSKKIP